MAMPPVPKISASDTPVVKCGVPPSRLIDEIVNHRNGHIPQHNGNKEYNRGPCLQTALHVQAERHTDQKGGDADQFCAQFYKFNPAAESIFRLTHTNTSAYSIALYQRLLT